MSGSLLPKPDTKKKSFSAHTQRFLIASSSMRGWRMTSEDAHAICVDTETSFFGLFDGHGGKKVSDYVSKHLYESIIQRNSFKTGDIKGALEESFVDVDERMRQDTSIRNDDSGATGIVVLIRNDKLYCANVGDSRAVAYVHGDVVPLSADHKPENPQEMKRIQNAGGTVSEGRINDDLGVSRAFGDFRFKSNTERTLMEQWVICFPDIVEETLNTRWEFVVLACDGIWDVMSNEQVCRFVKSRIVSKILPKTICEELMTQCLFKQSAPGDENVGTDNMTVIIVVFSECVKTNYKPSLLGATKETVKYISSDIL